MNKILILGFGVASTAYISLLDHNKKKVSVSVSYTHLTLPTKRIV